MASFFLTHSGNLIRNKDERDHIELECQLSLQRWDDAVGLLKQMLHRNPDQWSHIEVYISCQIQRYKKSVREARAGHGKVGTDAGSSGGDREGGKKEEVWEGRGEEEEEEGEGGGGEEEGEGGGGEEEGEGGGGEEEGERMNQLDTAEGGTYREIPRLVC